MRSSSRVVGEVQDIAAAAGVLAWDQRTKMPSAGAPARADQLSTLTRIAFERFTSDEIGELLDELEPWGASLDRDSDEASLIRVARRDYDKARKVPIELRAEMARASALGDPVWREARQRSDFQLFLPHLERAVELKKRYIECFQPVDEPYDALLDDYEPGVKTAEVRAVFDELKAGLVPLVAAIAERADAVDDSALTGDFPLAKQQDVEATVLHAFGFRDEEWRVDETAHPFASRRRPERRPPDDDAPRGQHELAVRLHARVRTRALRVPGRPRALPHAARPRSVARRPRVAEPHVGEHGRPQPARSGSASSRPSATRTRPGSAASTPSRSTGPSTACSRR